MPIPEPADLLWAEVAQLTKWPDTDEDAARAMAAGWRDGGDHFTRASAFDLSPVVDGWQDTAGQAFHGRTAEGLRAAASTGARMAEVAGHADAFAAEVTGVKNGIHELMAANQAGFAQAAAMPANVRAGFVRQVAGMVDTMKAEAAARIAAAAPSVQPPGDRRPLDEILRDYQVAEDPDGLVDWPPFPYSLQGTRRIPASEAAVLTGLLLDETGGQLLLAKGVVEEVEARAAGEFVDGQDGHQDAFRHVYLNARLAQTFGETFAKDLGIAHERGPSPVTGGPNPASREAMDLYNNEVGRAIGTRHPSATADELAGYIREAVATGHYTDGAGNRIPAPIVVNDSNGNLAYSDTIPIGETGTAREDVVLPGRDPSQVGLSGG
jgi:hypothetical protein